MSLDLSRRWLCAGLVATMASRGRVFAQPRAPEATVIRNATILTMEPAAAAMPASDLLIADGAIRRLGQGIAVPAGTRVIDGSGHIVLPGLVDTHFHMWNSILRGLSHSAKGGFAPTMKAVSSLFAPQDNALGVSLAAAQAIDSGITSIHNWAHNTIGPDHAEAEFAALADSGLRGRFAYGYPQALPPGKAMDLAHLAAMARRGGSGLVRLGTCLRGPDRSDEAVWRQEWAASRRLGLPLSTHIASDRKAAATGGIDTLAAQGLLGPDTMMVHATHATSAQLALLARSGAPLSISPWTELAVGYGISPVAAMARAGVPMGLSADNVVLAGQVDMFAIMRMTADLTAGLAETQQAIDDRTILQWATRDGARALGIDRDVGTIAPGKRADLIMVDGASINTRGASDPVTAIVRAARPVDVRLVMIDGEVRKADGKVRGFDRAQMDDRAAERLAQLRATAQI